MPILVPFKMPYTRVDPVPDYSVPRWSGLNKHLPYSQYAHHTHRFAPLIHILLDILQPSQRPCLITE